MNWKFEAVKLGVTERVEMAPEKVKDGRKAQDKRKEIESEKSIRRKNYESRKKMRCMFSPPARTPIWIAMSNTVFLSNQCVDSDMGTFGKGL